MAVVPACVVVAATTACQHAWILWLRRRPASRRGLGLVVTRQIAERHGGRVWVEERDARARVVVALPAIDPHGASRF